MVNTGALLGAIAFYFSALLAPAAFAAEGGIRFTDGPAAKAGVVATFGGKEILVSDLEKDDPAVFAARLELYRAQKAATVKLIQRWVLEAEAKKAGLDPAAFLAREMEKSKTGISTGEVEAYLREKEIADPRKVSADVRQQVRELLQVKKIVELAAKNTKAVLHLASPKPAATLEVGTTGDPALGDPHAPLLVVEFGDFQCEYCAEARSRISELIATYGRRLRFVYKHFPLPMHPQAMPAAEASMCVWEQSPEKFWIYYEQVFNQRDKLSPELIEKLAKDTGVAADKFTQCFKSKKYVPQIQASIAAGKKLGVEATPSFIIGGRLFKGTPKLADIKELLRE